MNEFDRNATLSHQNTESQQRSQKPTNSSLHYSVLILYIIYITCVYHTHAAAAAKSFQSCPTLCNPIDSSPLGSPVPGILQVRILEWVAIPFSRISARPRDQIQVSCIAGRFSTILTSREAQLSV